LFKLLTLWFALAQALPTAVPTQSATSPSVINCNSVSTCTFLDSNNGAGGYYFFQSGGLFLGSSGSYTPVIMSWGNGIYNISYSFTSASGGVSGITPQCYGDTYQGATNNLLAQDCAGDLGVLGMVKVNGGSSYPGWLAPVYTNAGAPTAFTEHKVRGQFSTTLSGTCTASTVCTLAASSVGFTNVLWAGAGTYFCELTNALPTTPLVWDDSTQTASAQSLVAHNYTTSTLSNGATATVNYDCDGY
jgi:hypothetical protein